MTIWHVQNLYTSAGNSYKVLPYDLVGMMKVSLKMTNTFLSKHLDNLLNIP